MPNPYRGPDGKMISKAEAEALAEPTKSTADRERERARSRGVPETELDRWGTNVFWVMSARTDDRVVLFERDPRHPGGEAFLAGPTPDYVYRTPQIQQLVMQGMLIEVPEPKRTIKILQDGEEIEIANPRYPREAGIEAGILTSAQPGRPIPLGRKLDPDLYDAEAIALVERRLAGRPNEIVPSGAYVPSAAEVDRPA